MHVKTRIMDHMLILRNNLFKFEVEVHATLNTLKHDFVVLH
jgi:hypothetical protein